jgi:hypothetical protein
MPRKSSISSEKSAESPPMSICTTFDSGNKFSIVYQKNICLFKYTYVRVQMLHSYEISSVIVFTIVTK